jgi:hypothetical protein
VCDDGFPNLSLKKILIGKKIGGAMMGFFLFAAASRQALRPIHSLSYGYRGLLHSGKIGRGMKVCF